MVFSPENLKIRLNSREIHAFIQTATYPPFPKGTPLCSTIPLGSLHNQHLDPAPPIACIPFPSPVKMTVQVKYWF